MRGFLLAIKNCLEKMLALLAGVIVSQAFKARKKETLEM
jgi:hypothetical protein